MLYNQDFLFLHCPKTAGKSVAVWFCQTMCKPIHGVVSPGQFREIGMGPQDGVYLERGSSHDDFATAATHLKARGRDITTFKALLLPIRNPYDLVVSKYFYMREAYAKTPELRERPFFKLAAEQDFATFCAQAPLGEITRFMPPAGARSRQPPVTLLPVERLGAALAEVSQQHGLCVSPAVPHINKGQSSPDRQALFDAQTKAIVDKKMASWFEIGGYDPVL